VIALAAAGCPFAHGTAGSSTVILTRLVSRAPTDVIAVEHTHYSSFTPRAASDGGFVGCAISRPGCCCRSQRLWPASRSVSPRTYAAASHGSDRSSLCSQLLDEALWMSSGLPASDRTIRGFTSSRRHGS
jgi:hypothetical protein